MQSEDCIQLYKRSGSTVSWREKSAIFAEKQQKEYLQPGKRVLQLQRRICSNIWEKRSLRIRWQMQRMRSGLCVDWHGQVWWGYPPDRSECDAWKRRDHAHRSAWRCDERIGTDRDQLYPFCGRKYKIPEDFFKKHDIHIHIPEGAVPKEVRLQVSQWRRL